MPTFYRPSFEIRRQIQEFRQTLPEGMRAPPQKDFAAQLQWDAWQAHLKELEVELEAALLRESFSETHQIGGQKAEYARRRANR